LGAKAPNAFDFSSRKQEGPPKCTPGERQRPRSVGPFAPPPRGPAAGGVGAQAAGPWEKAPKKKAPAGRKHWPLPLGGDGSKWNAPRVVSQPHPGGKRGPTRLPFGVSGVPRGGAFDLWASGTRTNNKLMPARDGYCTPHDCVVVLEHRNSPKGTSPPCVVPLARSFGPGRGPSGAKACARGKCNKGRCLPLGEICPWGRSPPRVGTPLPLGERPRGGARAPAWVALRGRGGPPGEDISPMSP
jgi:hypothetical protein